MIASGERPASAGCFIINNIISNDINNDISNIISNDISNSPLTRAARLRAHE